MSKLLPFQEVLSNLHGISEVYAAQEQRCREKIGYSQAIDVWSVGCLTAIILTNEFIFPNNEDMSDAGPSHRDYLEKLSALDRAESWKRLNRRTRSFVRDCLVVDEHRRMTAKQGLQHQWFTNSQYGAALEAAYLRAIQDWRPRGQKDDLIEYCEVPDVSPSRSDPGLGTRSHHFASSLMPPPFMPASPFPMPDKHLEPTKRVRAHTPLSPINTNSLVKNAESRKRLNNAASRNRLGSDMQSPVLPSQVILEDTQNYSIQAYAPPPSSQFARCTHSNSKSKAISPDKLPASQRRRRSSLDMDNIEELEKRLQLAAYNSRSQW